MSYIRVGDDSDIYIIRSTISNNRLECCGCILDPLLRNEFPTFGSVDELLVHVEKHKAVGHKVPQRFYDNILRERREKYSHVFGLLWRIFYALKVDAANDLSFWFRYHTPYILTGRWPEYEEDE